MAWGYLARFKFAGDEVYKRKAIDSLEWLKANKAPGYEEYSWGKTHDFASRGGRQAKFEPITIWTSLIGLVFLDAYELTRDNDHLETAKSICSWILKVPQNQTSTGICINYTPHDAGDCTIHNQSMVAAAMLAKTYKHTGNKDYLSIATQAIQYSCTHQNPDGSWYYGEGLKWHWIDNFHTGYNLDSLKCYIESTGDKTWENNLKDGFEFYLNNFFEESGRPKYYHNRTYPIESQCIAQSIETLGNFAEYDLRSIPAALKVADWAIDNMQDKTGYFYYAKYPLLTLKVPLIHWAQATTYRALALLLTKTAPE
jgi:rhamnogalacturonyl hydrolase YesR